MLSVAKFFAILFEPIVRIEPFVLWRPFIIVIVLGGILHQRVKPVEQ